MKRQLRSAIVLGFCALSAGAAAATQAEDLDFDSGVKISPALRASPGPLRGNPADDSLWISVSPSDLPKIQAAGLLAGVSVLENAQAVVFKAAASELPELSAFMHETFHRCGGFFAHRTLAEAQADLKPSPAALAAAYTIDQQAWAAPLLSRVQEGQIRGTIETLSAYHNRYYASDTGVEAARWIASRWQSLAAGLPGAASRLVAHDGWKQPSVVLTIPGSELPDEIVVLGGHLDSINGWGRKEARAPGADDNASGISVLTETIRVLSEAGFRPRRTVEFMGYAAEEVGLRGSQDIAEQYKRAGKKVIGVAQFDMTNFKGSPDDIYLLTDHVDAGLTAFMGKLIDAYLPGVKRSTLKCGYACSDHASWTRSGFASACPFESAFDDMNRNIHTDHDSLANSGGDARHSVNFAKLGVAFAVETAKTAQGFRLTQGPRAAR